MKVKAKRSSRQRKVFGDFAKGCISTPPILARINIR
jgi:hypothetical protein